MAVQEGREATLGKPVDVVEALDHIEFPQGPSHVERTGEQACDLDAELAPVAGMRERNVAYVVLEVEVDVVDPVRMIQVHRDANEPLSEGRRKV